MRAKELVAGLAPTGLRKISSALGVSPDAADVVRAMQGAHVYELAAGACVSAVMNEDLILLCANPFDTVSGDELAEADSFAEIGLISPLGDDEYVVNLDMALAAAPFCSVEFGFAATLIARLAPEERAVVAKAMEIGPRPSAIDTILDSAETLVTETTVMKHVAFLKSDERKVLETALDLGELPDDLENFPLDSSPPLVTLDEGAAGRRGLVFWVSHEASGVDARPVVPLEVAAVLPRILEQVPPPPDVVASKSRRRRTGTTRRPPAKKEAASAAASTESAQPRDWSRDMTPGAGRSGATRSLVRSGSADPRENAASSSGVLKPVDPLAGSGSISAFGSSGSHSPYRLGKVTNIKAASALVDVETAKVAQDVMLDEELAESVLEIVADSFVVLRAGVDPQEWAQACAVRLGL